MRLPPAGAKGLESRDWEGFKQDVNDFFTDLFDPVCQKFPKTLGCPKQKPEPEPAPPVVVPTPNLPNPPNVPNPNPPGNPGHTPPGQAPPITTPVTNPGPTTPAANPPPAATTAPAPVIPAPQPTQAPGNGNDGNGNDGGGNGNNDGNGNGGGGGNGGDGNTDPGSGGSNPSPTQGAGGGSEPQPTTTRAGQGNGRPQNLGGNVLLVGSNTASGPRPTSFADSQSGVTDELEDGHDDPAPGPIFNNDADGPGPGRALIDNDSASQSPTPKPTGGYHGGLNNDNDSGAGPTSNDGGGFNGGGISGGDGGPGPTNPENSNAAGSPLPGIIGAVVALLVLFLIVFALLYKYRRTRRVQSFLIRFTPLKIAAYSKLDRKRSSMGSELMFGCRGEPEPYTDEKRPWSMNYGSMDTAPAVTQPNPVAARRSCATDLPPKLELNISLANSVRSASPTSQFEPSPQSPSYPNMRTPPPARHSPRTSQDSTGGLSIASSGVFSPSMITWPMPPSTANSAIGSPPGTSYTANTAETYDTGPIIVGRSTPTRFKPIKPAQPSNWKKPQNWDV